jgi:amino acid transporter
VHRVGTDRNGRWKMSETETETDPGEAKADPREGPTAHWSSAPRPVTLSFADSLPESIAYRVKRALLGPPIVSDRLSSERLGKPTALAVLSSDVMSSSAYATEEMLRVLIPVGGLAAFGLVTPLTLLVLAVLAVVTICYRDVVASYPKAGGSYVVSRDNFGPNVAQVAGAALLVSYTITVAVSVAAGVDAIISVAPALGRFAVEMSIAFVVLIAFANLRGLREAGKVFALPTYFFIVNMAVLVLFGLYRWVTGSLGHVPHSASQLALAPRGNGLFLGVSAFYVLRAFANGGSAMTGTEAISNGVSVFRAPQAKNARFTLVLMSCILGGMFLGVSVLAALTHSVPFVSGTPTVVSEIGRLVYGSGPGKALYVSLQVATAVILVLAANTSYTGFPFLVSFVAEDSFLPRQLTVRGHRLVFSNGILVLTVVSIALLLATSAQVASLIPMYAIGVFTGFTMAGAGMTKHHLRHREGNWRRGVAVNGVAAAVCIVVVGVFAATEFTHGAWVVVIVMPLLILMLVRTNRRYRTEARVLEEGAAVAACEVPVLRRHVVLVLVDRIDLATARAIQYARTLSPDELRAVHFNIDESRSELLVSRWRQLGLSRLPLDVIECPDRRLGRAALELAAELADGETEVSMLLPRRAYRGTWGRLLHDHSADRIVETVSQLSHVNATIVPFNVVGGLELDPERAIGAPSPEVRGHIEPGMEVPERPGDTPIASLEWRDRATVTGRVRAMRIQPWSGVSTVECTLVDSSRQTLLVVFLGRREVPGIRTGTVMSVEGRVGTHRGHLAMFNPRYEIRSHLEE